MVKIQLELTDAECRILHGMMCAAIHHKKPGHGIIRDGIELGFFPSDSFGEMGSLASKFFDETGWPKYEEMTEIFELIKPLLPPK